MKLTNWNLLGAFFILSVVGCGGGEDYGTPVTVTGVVTLDDQPLSDAQITFHALAGLPGEYRTRMIKTGAQGEYTLEEVYPAEYKVMVQKINYDPEEARADGGVSEDDPLAKYGAESELSATVSADQTTFDFKLEGS